MKTALLDIQSQFKPDRILIESSGAAFPATLALQVADLARETRGAFSLDGVLTVIDCANFRGHDDESPAARMQAAYSDAIILNKFEAVTERELDLVLDAVHTLNDMTPKLRAPRGLGVPPALVFGLDAKLAQTGVALEDGADTHGAEIEARTVGCMQGLTRATLDAALEALSKESVYRVKGFVRFPDSVYILNWAFGRPDYTLFVGDVADKLGDRTALFTLMGEPGELTRRAARFAAALGGELAVPRGRDHHSHHHG